MRTYVAKGEEAEALKIGANWFVVDATDVVLGRLATKVARMLIGKDKPSFTPYLDSGDHVVVINAEKVRMTGKKITKNVNFSHSGYTGGCSSCVVALSSTGMPIAGKQTWFLGTGRRKESVARVFLRPGAGKFSVNGRTVEQYFPNHAWKHDAVEPLKFTNIADQVDVVVT